MIIFRLVFLLIASFLFLTFHAYTEDRLLQFQDTTLIEQLKSRNVRLIVIRHGKAIHNIRHLMSSSMSPGVYLTEEGIDQVKKSAEKLRDEKIDHVYASPVYRTMQTAQIIGDILQIPYLKMSVDEDIREQFYGEFEELPYEDYEAYFQDPLDVHVLAVPGGESGSHVFQRIQRFLKKIASKHENETILIVTHAFPCCQISMCLTGSFSNTPKQAEFKIYDFTNVKGVN